VNRLGFGAMRIVGPGVWGEPADPAAARAVLRRAVELGVDFIDTADSYGPEVSERLIAEALHPYPDGLVIATKAGYARPGPGRWVPDNRPEHLRAACEGSLERLRLERIDLLQLHAIDPGVPLEESVGMLATLQAEGKIRHIGLSNVDQSQLERAGRSARIVSVQNRLSVSTRFWDDVLAACERHGLAFVPYRPLDLGAMGAPEGPLARIAAAHGASPQQVALAWLLAHSPVTLPIPGTSSLAHLEANVQAASLELGPDEVETLTSAPGLAGAARTLAYRLRHRARRLRPRRR
jgi:aryl-alcohol dehydrogenase-like predicted oxidoreductase